MLRALVEFSLHVGNQNLIYKYNVWDDAKLIFLHMGPEDIWTDAQPVIYGQN